MFLLVDPEFAKFQAIGKLSCSKLEELILLCVVYREYKLFQVLSLKLIGLNSFVDECPDIVVVRAFELPADRILSRIFVVVITCYDRVLLNSNGFAGNEDGPCIIFSIATEVCCCIAIAQLIDSVVILDRKSTRLNSSHL